jgi:hypothetical protein
MYPLAFQHIQRVAIEDAQKPGAEGTTLLEARESTPGQEKRALGDFFGQRALVAQAHCGSHGRRVMGLPELAKFLLVSVRRAFDEICLTGRHTFPPSLLL